jgi:hypothetical protein
VDKRTALPLCALLTSTAVVTLLIVQTVLACTDKVALSVPAATMAMMPGMDMSSMSDPAGGPMLLVCPVVLVLLALSVLLTATASALVWRDPHRSLALRAIVRSLAELPPGRAAAAAASSSAGAVALMVRVDGMGPSGPMACVTVLALLAVCSVCAAFLAIAAGRIAVELSRRLILAIVAAVARTAPAVAPPAGRYALAITVARDVALLARGRGLRAPPSFVR